MEVVLKKKIYSEEDTVALAEKFADELTPGEVIVLNGNLGAGKTFFVRQALKKLNIDNVSSPTFAIVNEYNGQLKVYHFDFYRINDSAELFDIGFNDYLNDTDSVTFIEWGSLMPSVLPRKRLEINITVNEDFSREFIFERHE